MKKFWISLTSMFVVINLPIAGFFIYGENTDSVYHDTFYAELNDKIDLIKKTEEKKIVFVGGSSLIFGLRSEEIEKATGYKVVDFGLYAQLGTTFMMKIAMNHINSGDIVVIAPEISEETYSDNIGYLAAHKCFESINYKVADFTLTENVNFFFSYFRYILEKNNAVIDLEEPYTKSSFNEYGDIDNPIVENNILEEYYDATQPIVPSKDIIDSDFVREVNRFNRKVTRKGAKVYFSFSPSNSMALQDEHIEEFEQTLEKKLDCPLLGSVKDFTYHQYYFYDTNYHLNRTGTYLHSKNLVDLIREKESIDNDYQIPVNDPPKPKYYDPGIEDIVDGVIYSQRYAGDELYYSLKGFTDEKKNISSFEVPSEVRGVKVESIGLHAFKDMPNLTEITIPETITKLMNPLFDNCPNVVKVILRHVNPPQVCSTGLIDGASPNCRIYVPISALLNYTANYNWVNYYSVIAPYSL